MGLVGRFLNFGSAVVARGPDFIYRFSRVLQTRFDKWKIDGAIAEGMPLVLVYQPGRVASTSIYASLAASEIKFPIYHVHVLSPNRAEKAIQDAKVQGRVVRRNFVTGKIIGQGLSKLRDRPPTQPWKIISVFRDPVSVMLSLHFMRVERYFAAFLGPKGELSLSDATDHFRRILENDDPSGWGVMSWYERVFHDELGVDVYQYPFDVEKGYAVIRTPLYDVLLLRFEDLNTAFSKGVADLFGPDVGEVTLLHHHLHKDDRYADLHEQVKRRLKVSRSACERIYSTRFVQHFYSSEQISGLIDKWSGSS